MSKPPEIFQLKYCRIVVLCGFLVFFTSCNSHESIPPLAVQTSKTNICLDDQQPQLVSSYKYDDGRKFAAIKINAEQSQIYAVSSGGLFGDGVLSQHLMPNLSFIVSRTIGSVSLFATVFDSGANWIASASADKPELPTVHQPSYSPGSAIFRGITLWDLSDNRQINNSDKAVRYYSYLAFAPNGHELIAIDDMTFDYIQVPSLVPLGTEIDYVPNNNWWMAINYDQSGEYVAKAGSNGVIRIDKIERKNQGQYSSRSIVLETPFKDSDPTYKTLATTFDPSRRTIVVLRTDGLFQYSLSTGNKARLGEGSQGDYALTTFHPRGDVIAIASQEGVRIFNLVSHKWTSISMVATYALDFSADGRYMMLGNLNGSIQLYDFCKEKLTYASQ